MLIANSNAPATAAAPFSASLADLNRAQMNNEGFTRFSISGAAKKVLLLPLHSQLPL